MAFLRRSVLGFAVCLVFVLPASALSQTSGPTPPTAAATWSQGWPMSEHDPQRTSRSPVAGPTRAHLLFKRKHIDVGLVDGDGNLYGGRVTTTDVIPVVLDPDGHQRVSLPLPLRVVGIAPDGILYGIGFNLPRGHTGPAQTEDAATVAFSQAGKVLWKIQPSGLLKGALPLVAQDGTLYAPFEGSGPEFAGLDRISPDGKQRYLQNGTPFFAMALAPSGTIYALTYSHATGGSYVEALDQAGQVLWQHPLRVSIETWGICRCLMVGRDGAVYATDGADLVAYTPSGQLLWRFHDKDGALALAERADGALLVAGRHALNALSPAGTVLWTARIGTTGRTDALPSLIVDTAGTAYVGTADAKVRIFSAGGTLLDRLSVGRRNSFAVPTSILAPNAKLIVNGTDGTLRVYGP